MNINELKQELAKKFANMSYEDFERFEHDLKVLYAHKHPNVMRIDKFGGVWMNKVCSTRTYHNTI